MILEHLPVVIAVIDRAGKVVSLNRAGREFSREFNTAPGTADWRAGAAMVQTYLIDGTRVPVEELQIAHAFRGEYPPQRELMLVSPDGMKRMHALAVAAPLISKDGQVQQVVTAFQDVTALRALADAKDRFLRVASHELRSPITSLRATTSLLEMDPDAIVNPERRAVMLQRIQRQVDRLIKLVEQLLDSARINAQQVPIEPVECELGQIADEAVAMAAPVPEERARVSVVRQGPLRGAWDPLRLEQVLTNLVGNALRYSPAGAPVELRLVDADPVRIEVVDRGIGIPPDQLDQVFSPFFRGSNAQAQHKGGLGLGLHITAEIVRRHGGSIRVQSELGRGSTFTVELPRRQT
jgi:signal transduction histidine kinase